MKIEGEDAKLFRVVRLDTFENANKGELVSADELTGYVAYKDAAGEVKTLTLGDHAIRIMPR
jgi:hypothetical protein